LTREVGGVKKTGGPKMRKTKSQRVLKKLKGLRLPKRSLLPSEKIRPL
jgi:hypothetical protein